MPLNGLSDEAELANRMLMKKESRRRHARSGSFTQILSGAVPRSGVFTHFRGRVFNDLGNVLSSGVKLI
jgi:hypothetical protein